MSAEALVVVQSGYAAFGRGDVAALLDLMADDVEWKFCGSKGLPYTGTFRGKNEVPRFFAGIPEVEDILVFEPREFISAGEKLCLGGSGRKCAPVERSSRANGFTFSRYAMAGSYASGACTTLRHQQRREFDADN